MNTEIQDIIVKVLNGEAKGQEKDQLIKWLYADKLNSENFKLKEAIWNSLSILSDNSDFNVEDAFDEFRNRIYENRSKFRNINVIKMADWFIRIAAIIFISFGLTYFLFIRQEKLTNPKNKDLSEVIVPSGSKSQLNLPDGTKVWLNSESKISYYSDFNTSERNINLEGEGYFEVAKNPEIPFIVNTSGISIKAIGTSFNIKAYPSEETVETTLIEGKLEIENNTEGEKSEPVILAPNQKVVFYRAIKPVTQTTPATVREKSNVSAPMKTTTEQIVLNNIVDPHLTILWTNDILYFDNEEFQDLAVKLERRFGVSIRFLDDSIKKIRFSGKFKDIILEQVLAALQFASPFYYSVDDKYVFISNKPITWHPSIN